MTKQRKGQVDMKLEVEVISVSDVDRAKAFYQGLGWRLDADFSTGDFRILQLTPHNSKASIFFGKGVTSAEPGSAKGLVLAVEDVGAARDELIAHGANVSEVFHYAGGPFNNTGEHPRVSGRDPEGRSYFSFASFEDPDGNGWILQEITTRLPGREWAEAHDRAWMLPPLPSSSMTRNSTTAPMRSRTANTIGGTGYAPYLSARQNGPQSGGRIGRRRPLHGGVEVTVDQQLTDP